MLADFGAVPSTLNGGVKSGHWAAQNPATLDLGVTRATWRRPVNRLELATKVRRVLDEDRGEFE